VRELAPAKVNLNLYLGPLRADGRHELLSAMQSITLCDELEMADGERDEVVCAAIAGPNLAATALGAFRAATGWDGPGQRIEIVKRIPVAAGMGGGSADAAAALRSDVAGQLRPGRVLVRGGGERVEPLPDPVAFGVLVLPSQAMLATAAVYREADRLGLPRSERQLAALDPLAGVGVNDLEPASRSLEPSITAALEHARAVGARPALVCGSGPTVIGLFDDPLEASRAAATLVAGGVEACAARPYPRAFGAPA
jgi:4-diphosphocytidyl-2-C-methyl-D-erythritol kinase